MKNIQGKWMYNAGLDEENWRCDEGEFDTKEEAIKAGKKYFTEPDGYEDYEGEKFEGSYFTVGQIAYPDFHISSWDAIERATEQAYEQCGEWAESWLEKISKEDEKLLSGMLTEAFKKWLSKTKNEPNFYTLKYVSTFKLDTIENQISFGR